VNFVETLHNCGRVGVRELEGDVLGVVGDLGIGIAHTYSSEDSLHGIEISLAMSVKHKLSHGSPRNSRDPFDERMD
jgi:hypothetical protein